MQKENLENSQHKVVYISWADSCSRSDQTARELGGTSFKVYLSKLGSHPLTIPIKYAGQCLMTWRILLRERPSVTFVMSPPVFAALTVWLYKLVRRTHLVMDCHTAAFMHSRWKLWQWLQYFLARRATTNIVHNDHLADLVRKHAARAIVVKDVPVVYQRSEAFEMREGFNVAIVCSFNEDEPIDEIFEAARLLPDIQFYMTGDTKFLDAEIAQRRPANIKLTGFISDAAYGCLLTRASVVMSLTTRDHTMLRGAWEAIYQATPVIVSDWPCLRSAFTNGAKFTDNTAGGIADSVKSCCNELAKMREGALVSRRERLQRWQVIKLELLHVCGV